MMNTFIDTALTPFVGFLLEWSLRWLVVAALPILWLWLRPPRDPRLRYQICLATLAAGLLLPVIPRWGGLVPIQPTPATEQVAAPEVDRPVEVAVAPFVPLPQMRPEPVAAIPDEIVVPPEAIVVQDAPVSEPIDWRPILIRWVTFVTASVWLVGVLIFLVRWIAGSLFLRRLRDTAIDVDAATTELFQACKRELLVSRRVRLAVHHGVASPVLIDPRGLAILLPASWAQLPPALQRASLLHELAHVVRRDDWIALALRVTDLAMFFHPCYRWLRSRLECEREICCDDLALASGVEADGYAQMLRDFARQPGRFRSTSPAIPFGQPSTIKARIQHVFEKTDMDQVPRSRLALCSVSLLIAMMVALGCVRVHAPKKQNESREPSLSKADTEKTDEVSAPLVPFDQMTYGGKSFEQWQETAKAELKPESRMEAFRALGTFGINGRADAAAKCVTDIMAFYNPRSSYDGDKPVIECAWKELARIGPGSIPTLQATLRKGNTNARRFAAMTLKKMEAKASDAESSLMESLKDKDLWVRTDAALALLQFSNCSSREFAMALAETLSTRETEWHQWVLKRLGNLGRKAVDAVPILATFIRDDNWNKELSSSVGSTILEIGGNPEKMIPVYKLLFNHALTTSSGGSNWSWGKYSSSYAMIEKILQDTSSLGRAAKEFAPTLIDSSQKIHWPVGRAALLKALIDIEAEPKDVIPLIKGYLASPDEQAYPGMQRDEKQIRAFETYLKKHAAPESTKPPVVWSPFGTLERTSLIDQQSRRFYRLTPENMKPKEIIYCLADPGVDLDAHVNQHVKLYGAFGYHRDMRQNFLQVADVQKMAEAPGEASK